MIKSDWFLAVGHWVSIAPEDPGGSLSRVNHCVFVEVRLCPLGSLALVYAIDANRIYQC